MPTVNRVRLADMQQSARDGENGAGRDDIDMVRLDRRVVPGFEDRHGRVTCEQVFQQAVVRPVETLDDDDSATGIWRNNNERAAARAETADRCPDRAWLVRLWPGGDFGRHRGRPFLLQVQRATPSLLYSRMPQTTIHNERVGSEG